MSIWDGSDIKSIILLLEMIFSVLKRPLALFTVCRYGTFMINMCKGLVIARFVAPEYFGIWGFFLVVQEYLSYSNLGLHYALNTELSIKHNKTRDVRLLCQTGLSLTIIVSVALFIVAFGIIISGVPIFPKYRVNEWLLLGVASAVLTLFRQVHININRVLGKLNIITLTELCCAVILFGIAFTGRDKQLVWNLMCGLVLSGLLSNIVFFWRSPVPFQFKICRSEAILLLRLGLQLLAANIAFYFMLLSARSVVSWRYTLAEMGIFSFATNLSAASLLGINAVMWALYPNMLASTREGLDDNVVKQAVYRLNNLYGSAVQLMVIISVLALPLLFRFLPKYRDSFGIITILLLGQIVLSQCSGNSTIITARRKQGRAALNAVAGLLLVLIGSIAVALHSAPTIFIALSVFMGYCLYAVLQIVFSRTIIELGTSGWKCLRSVYDPLAFLCLLGALIGAVKDSYLISVIGLGLMLLASHRQIRGLIRTFSGHFSRSAVEIVPVHTPQ